MTKPYHVFISYATEDEAFTKEIVGSLKHLGVRVWFAPLSLEFGSNLLSSINAGLKNSEFGFAVLSPIYIAKKWTGYELDIMMRQHIEQDKKLFPVWHGVTKKELDDWNEGIAGIVAMNSTEGAPAIAEKIAKRVYKGSPTVGVSPSYENPQWRFLQGQGELFANTDRGRCFNIYEAAEFTDDQFPLYVHDKLYSKEEIILGVAAVFHYSNPDAIPITTDRKKRLLKLCKDHGYDVKDKNFDPAMHGW
ncbi:toll/interleukin-1 receptor domain-containing protein [Janthinobacterium sp. YR213]|uniref:toll/interleukin-1 receptor domain-containing protein n=1 Tax=Janthinobacterium sp. YR213 TaxID=1881027 RepID=UPI000880F535|nr:toll/interleukin-1 receptor domain-containing protein [Janthinobacterium sp. YR213]SDH89798.1 TIR domain-containing protein [Janthinobacterium sp. YR213]